MQLSFLETMCVQFTALIQRFDVPATTFKEYRQYKRHTYTHAEMFIVQGLCKIVAASVNYSIHIAPSFLSVHWTYVSLYHFRNTSPRFRISYAFILKTQDPLSNAIT